MLSLHRFKDAKELYQGRKYEMLFWDNKASLAVKETMPSDSSKYRCEVSSPLGHVESIGSLTVYSMSLPSHTTTSMYKLCILRARLSHI